MISRHAEECSTPSSTATTAFWLTPILLPRLLQLIYWGLVKYWQPGIMARALCIYHPAWDPRELPCEVTGKTLLAMGEDLARKGKYLCLNEKCRVQVTVIFPMKVKTQRDKAAMPHFRVARKFKHVADCPYDRSSDEPKQSPSPPSRRTSIRANAPTRFLDTPHQKNTRQRGPDESLSDRILSVPRASRQDGGVHQSRSGAHELCLFVEYWHSPADRNPGLELQLKGCPGNTYGQVFREIDRSVAAELSQKRFIYWIVTSNIYHFGSSGYSVRLDWPAGDYRGLSVWVPKQIAGEPLPDVLRSRLESKAPVTIYIVGRFAPNPKLNTLDVQPQSINHVWVELGCPGQTPKEK